MLIDHVPVTALKPIPVAASSEVWVCGRSLTGTADIRILQEALRSVSCACCVFSGRDLCDGPITRPEESY